MLDKLKLDVVKNYFTSPVPRQILFFDEMLTPRILQIVYWAALVAVMWQGLGRIFSGSLYGFVEGLVLIALGCLVARVVSELVMLFFQLHENMATLARHSTAQRSTASPSAASATKVTKKTAKKASKRA